MDQNLGFSVLRNYGEDLTKYIDDKFSYEDVINND